MKLNENYNILSSSKSLNSNSKKIRQPKFEVEEAMVRNKNNSKNDVEQSKKVSVKYVLEGGVIKVYLVQDGVKGECIKIIPLSKATPEILAQVENITFLNIINIIDIQKKEEQEDFKKSGNSPSLSKEIKEYMKHFGG